MNLSLIITFRRSKHFLSTSCLFGILKNNTQRFITTLFYLFKKLFLTNIYYDFHYYLISATCAVYSSSSSPLLSLLFTLFVVVSSIIQCAPIDFILPLAAHAT